jgi:23S rRNA-/tRNA-specific pseudouridylate synthase
MHVLNEFGSKRPRLRSWHARTSFRKLASSNEMSLLEVEMQTGVTHQIRVHLAATGHAIVGDTRYGFVSYSTDLGRHFLHASRLEFAHPASGKSIALDSPLPSELRSFLKRMKIVD